MDYEKKYNEALSQARFYYGNCPTEPEKKKLENIFPELRESESEDEKIRTLLVALVQWAKTFNQSGLDPNTSNKMLYYLEKQKEQKPVELDEELELGLDRARQIVFAAKGNLEGYQSDDGIYECDSAIEAIDEILKNGITTKPAECIEDSVKFEEGFKVGRESGLRDGQKYVLNNLDFYGLCKVSEWSEEDEKVYNNALDALFYKDLNNKDDVLSVLKDLCDLISRKRKVIPPYSRWKPGDEQIKALGAAIVFHKNDPHIDMWRSLYNDLQKIR